MTAIRPGKILNRYVFMLAATVLLAVFAAGESFPHWVGAWASSQQLAEPRNSLTGNLRDVTLRQIVRVTLGGNEVRVRLSNRFGKDPIHFTGVHIARPLSTASSRIDPATDRALSFSGKPDVIIPQGADYLSDPISFPLVPFTDVAITLHGDLPAEQTGHPGSRTTSYLVQGDQLSTIELTNAETMEHWYFIAGIDVIAPVEAGSIVVLGDSITDGHGATTNQNNRWPDLLAKRIQANPGTKMLSVLNHGIGGNRLLLDGLGPNALKRFDSDVIAQPGVRYLIILEGINDFGEFGKLQNTSVADHELLVHRITGAFEQMIARAHTNDIKVIGCTILPFMGTPVYNPGPAIEADRQTVNKWIRGSGRFDAVVDFDQLLRDPAQPDRLLPALDTGDHLHPSVAGFEVMAKAIPLSLFGTKEVGKKIAFTFDDLPVHSALPPGETRLQVIDKILAALRVAKLPPVYGFVNGVRTQEDPSTVAVLEEWEKAGQPVGNHTWSHMNLNQHTAEEFEQDIARNEPVLNQFKGGRDYHWLRYPFLSEGDTPEKRASVRRYLADHGYKVAAVTMSFGDYMWNEPYARCRQKGDQEAIKQLEKTYLAGADSTISYYRQMSEKLYNREIPYVLLMHVGAFDAEMLPQLIQLYRDRGYEFVSLEEAQQDDFYRSSNDPVQSSEPNTLERAMAEQHLPLPVRNAAPQLEGLCR